MNDVVFYDDWLLGFHDLGEHFWVFSAELRKDFAVEDDSALLEVSHDTRVGRAEKASGGVDADLHEATVVTLLEATVTVGVGAGFGGSNFSKRDAVLAAPHHSFGAG